MPSVTLQVPLSNDHTAHTPNATGQIDLALLLSDFYGKQIRQGNTFTITGAQAALRPANNSAVANVDKGISAQVVCSYLPTTKHSRKAWNGVFRQWRAQKNLKGAVGMQMRYDDMEFCFKSDDKTSRTSLIHAGGLEDSDSEYLTLTGSSSETVVSPSILEGFYSLEDYYNSQWPPAPASKYHMTGSSIKQPKFGNDKFPPHQHFNLSAESTAQADYMGAFLGIDNTILTSSGQSSPIEMFPQPIHVMCGLIHYDAYVMPDEDWIDDEFQLSEDFELYVTIWVKSWKSLVYRRKSKPRRYARKMRGSRKSRGYGRYRRSRKRR